MARTGRPDHVLVGNRAARHQYDVLEIFEAGIELVGCEVKSLRAGQANLQDGFVQIRRGEAWLVNMHVSPYPQGNRENPEPRRTRRLLLHRHELRRLAGRVAERGLTLVPLSVKLRGRRVKVEVGLARGRHTYDKKRVLKERDLKREAERALRGRD